MNILVTGASGQLGSEIKRFEGEFVNLTLFPTDITELDITSIKEVNWYVEKKKIDGIINCAAYTAVDKAEDEFNQAASVNINGPDVLSTVAAKHDIRFIHISTDYVFDGKVFLPYKESDYANPSGVYGLTKLEGEKRVYCNHPGAIIIRTSWLFSSFGKNFVKTMLQLMGVCEEVGVVADQFGTPTYAADLAKVVLEIVQNQSFEQKAGLYHYSNEGVASWYDFAIAIRDLAWLDCQVKPLKTEQYSMKAERPYFSVLDKSKIKASFQLEIPYWRDSLSQCMAILEHSSKFESTAH